MSVCDGYAPGTPNWVDLQSTDLAAAKGFYGRLFGWPYAERPSGDGGYWVAALDGAPVAAIMARTPPMRAAALPATWSTYIATPDVDAAAARAAAAGGELRAGPFGLPGAGRMAVVGDPAGAVVSLWQADGHAGAGRVNEPGALTWNELVSDDLDAALPFYEATLGTRARRERLDGDEYVVLLADERIVAGATARPGGPAGNHWHVWFGADDVDALAQAALAAGGSVLAPPADSDAGTVATLADPQGGVFSVIAALEPADAGAER